MLFCFTNISAEILLYVLGYSFGTKHHILAFVCQMLLPLKALKIKIGNMLCLATKMFMKLTPGACTIKHFAKVIKTCLVTITPIRV